MPKNKKKDGVLFICTGNACRSQIAHGLLADVAGNDFNVFSAGTHPSKVHPMAVKIMEEVGIDISKNTSNHINEYLNEDLKIVITVCDNAKQTCPVFPVKVKTLHWSIKDPFKGWNYDPSQLKVFRKTREEIKERIIEFLESYKQDT